MQSRSLLLINHRSQISQILLSLWIKGSKNMRIKSLWTYCHELISFFWLCGRQSKTRRFWCLAAAVWSLHSVKSCSWRCASGSTQHICAVVLSRMEMHEIIPSHVENWLKLWKIKRNQNGNVSPVIIILFFWPTRSNSLKLQNCTFSLFSSVN